MYAVLKLENPCESRAHTSQGLICVSQGLICQVLHDALAHWPWPNPSRAARHKRRRMHSSLAASCTGSQPRPIRPTSRATIYTTLPSAPSYSTLPRATSYITLHRAKSYTTTRATTSSSPPCSREAIRRAQVPAEHARRGVVYRQNAYGRLYTARGGAGAARVRGDALLE